MLQELPQGVPKDVRSSILNLGCGHKCVAGAVNLDITQDTNPEVIHDLNLRPWPFPDNQFREVLAYDVIEHLKDVIQTMEEIHRVCSHGAIIKITVPHFSCANAYTDPTHRHYFGRFSFDYVSGENALNFYTKATFKRRASQLIFYPTIINKIVSRVANRYAAAYEQRWAWMLPAWFVYFELEVVKKSQSKV